MGDVDDHGPERSGEGSPKAGEPRRRKGREDADAQRPAAARAGPAEGEEGGGASGPAREEAKGAPEPEPEEHRPAQAAERIFHPREEIELFSYMLQPTSQLGLVARHWILAPVMGGGCINLLCRGRRVADEVRAFAYAMVERIPFAHLYFAIAVSRYSLETILAQRQVAIIDRFEQSSIGNVDDVIQARRTAPTEAGVICITEVDPDFTTEDIYDDNRFSEMAVSGFFLFVMDESHLTGLAEPVITDEAEKVFQHFLRRFGKR